jgi:hypothetical protein
MLVLKHTKSAQTNFLRLNESKLLAFVFVFAVLGTEHSAREMWECQAGHQTLFCFD